MNRNWTPKSKVSVTDAGMVIEIEVGEVSWQDLIMGVDDGQLFLRWELGARGSGEISFEIPANYNWLAAETTFVKGVLRIELPLDKEPGQSKPVSMMIYCNGCGKHFDIVITGNGSKPYPCPACGKVHDFDLQAFVKKAMAQSRTMLRKKRGRG